MGTSPAATALYQLPVSTAIVSGDHRQFAFGDADTSEQQTTIPQASNSVAYRDNFGTLCGGAAPESPFAPQNFSPTHSPARESRKLGKVDQNITAKLDIPGLQKPQYGFCSNLSY